ncbi:carbohydrate ABC transporter permease [Paenibacillus eucommiae]|uniref:Raffinose/stachyose/melibiose transport system permease protein n=1 Tax=Paenibacillus eucommiae TaxID=1355755 RepID=A0ABS4J1K7_9BACL|nr:carbohydrate ABC transporter permease [Paenibacillus eucommiae]MBP1993151.1 raffinose/stachyose/melibiose transport system permease protein [Paenibacillus eucommiae]
MSFKIVKRSLLYTVAIGYALISLFPLVLMVISSLKPNIEIFTKPLSLPSKISYTSYETLFVKLNYANYIKNSIFVSGVTLLLLLVFSIMLSYYLARFKFKWSGLLFFYFLIGMMLPIKLGLVPLFLLIKDLNLVDSLWSIILIHIGTGMSMAVLILTGFFRTLPKELEEAGRIDGASNMGILMKILIPLMRPAIGTVVIINFIGVWNEFFFPMIFIQDEAKKTIPLGMLKLFGEFTTDWSVLFAGLTLSSLPMIIIFAFASKQFMEGLTAGAVK